MLRKSYPHLVWLLVPLLSAAGDESKQEPPAPPPLSPLEKKFVETLTDAVMVGRWRLVKDGKLGQESEEKYTIRSVSKLAGDVWLIGARIQYGGKDLTVPVPVKVLWAGDTPVITVTQAGIPGLGTYTARVLIYDGLYTGTWSGPGHGGFLSGAIVKEIPKDKDEGKPAPTAPAKDAGKAEPAR